MGMGDAELISRWQQGELRAFEALVERWQGPVGRFLARYVGDEDRAQDLCQEVFLRAYRGRGVYADVGAFRAWLYRVALNVARDAARRRRPPAVPLNGDGAGVADPRPSAEAVCERRETGRLVAEALAALPEPLRAVLLLRHYEQLSFEDIARATGTPASTLKSRFAAALARVRDHLRSRGWAAEEAD
jgi:RNA polymerase sigma-70 factor (ECF subfamily)